MRTGSMRKRKTGFVIGSPHTDFAAFHPSSTGAGIHFRRNADNMSTISDYSAMWAKQVPISGKMEMPGCLTIYVSILFGTVTLSFSETLYKTQAFRQKTTVEEVCEYIAAGAKDSVVLPYLLKPSPGAKMNQTVFFSSKQIKNVGEIDKAMGFKALQQSELVLSALESRQGATSHRRMT
jgi:hypothetical protein